MMLGSPRGAWSLLILTLAYITVVHGNWSSWSNWSGCSKTCGSGTQSRTRRCNQLTGGPLLPRDEFVDRERGRGRQPLRALQKRAEPPQLLNRRPCPGNARASRACNARPCTRPIDVGIGLRFWSPWSSWSRCSKTCGSGTQTRKRTCTTLDEGHPFLPNGGPIRPVRGGGRAGRGDVLRRVERQAAARIPAPGCQGTPTGSRTCNAKACPSPTSPSSKNGVTVYPFSKAIKMNISSKQKQFSNCLNTNAKGSGKSRVTTLTSCKAASAALPGGAGAGASKPGSGSTSCTNIPEYLRRITSGIDVTKLDFLAPGGSASSNGIRSSLYQFTCDLGSTITIGSTTYQLPDQIANVNALSVEDVGITNDYYTSSADVKKAKSKEFSLGGAFKGLGFSASYSYKSLQSSFKLYNRHYFDFKYVLASQSANIMVPSLVLDDTNTSSTVSGYISSRLKGHSYNSKPQDYQTFVTLYGTHLMVWAKFGGMIKTMIEVESNYHSKHSTVEVSKQANIAFKKFLSAKGASVTTTTTNSQEFTRSSELNSNCFGGNVGGSCASVNIASWRPTVEDKPHLFAGEGIPISFFVDDSQVRSALDIAICRHVGVSYLEDVIVRVNNLNTHNVLSASTRKKLNNLKSEAQSHVNKFNTDSQASQHQSLCSTVKNAFKQKAENTLNVLVETNAPPYALATVNHDQPMNLECRTNFHISKISAQYSSKTKDRRWSVSCGESSYKLREASTCAKTTQYVNNFHQDFTYNCPSNGVMTGMYSYHDNGPEDRRWQFRCCNLATSCSATCSWTPSFTAYEGNIDFNVPPGSYLAGVNSDARPERYRKWFLGKRRTKCDRVWKYKICKVNSC